MDSSLSIFLYILKTPGIKEPQLNVKHILSAHFILEVISQHSS